MKGESHSPCIDTNIIVSDKRIADEVMTLPKAICDHLRLILELCMELKGERSTDDISYDGGYIDDPPTSTQEV